MSPARTFIRCLSGIVVVASAPAVAHGSATPGDASRSAVAPYRGLAAWIDIYDAGPWARPAETMRALARRGVTTVFAQTSNYRQPHALHRPAALARIVRSAHRHQMQVIAWYLPGFEDVRRDWRRVEAAVTYETEGGHRFDGFALDIEATAVRDIATRNRRMLRLSSRLRRLAGERFPLGAIIPDPVSQRYWPGFPYAQVRAWYDVLLPMAYWTFHRWGAAQVSRYTRDALRLIRSRTGDRSVPVHVVGGIAGHASAAEVGGFARAAVAFGAAGASLYDAPITSAAQWERLSRIAALKPPEEAE